MSALLNMESRVSECSALFVERLSDFARRCEIVDMAHWLQCFAFDVVGAVTVSTPSIPPMVVPLAVMA